MALGDSVWRSGEQTTVNAVLDRRLETDPDSEYLDFNGSKFSAAEVENVGNRLANAYRGMGIKPGDRVAMLIENSSESMLAWWGAMRGNHVAVPINTAYKGDYLVHQLT